MNNKTYIILIIGVSVLFSCRQYIEKETTDYKYNDLAESDTVFQPLLIAISNEEYLQYGANIAFINDEGDTVIPFGKYAYFGTDTLKYYANVLEHPNDSTWGRCIGIDRNQNTLFDLVLFDNGPDYYNEDLTRVSRNGKMGFANTYGQVVIPCIYNFARWFENGKAEVTFDAREYVDLEEHLRVESDEWFIIDKKGNEIN